MTHRKYIFMMLGLGSLLFQFAAEASSYDLMPLLFILFLSFFVLVGIYPAVQKTLAKILRYLSEARDWRKQSVDQAAHFPRSWHNDLPQLDVYESLVLRRLALAGRRGMLLAGLIKVLGVDADIVEQSLASLSAKHLATSAQTFLAGKLYYLTAQGRHYAHQQGFVPTVKSTNRSAWI